MKTADARSESNARRSLLAWAGWLVLSFAAAAGGALFTPGEWYAALQKPAWSPPNWVFGLVWTLLYALMGTSAWLVWKHGGFTAQRNALSLWLLQWIFNALWTPLFFGLRSPALALVDIVLLWMALLATVVKFWQTRPIAGALLLPYLAWVTFAGGLNFALWQLNS